ncbi:HNH endonuclease signature motif containing protein [Microbacterium murale]|uniref:Murein DD-endopeptidase MepM/ murein hydrolase activator NlpD n=1 Tax=Microbacterium murale TaxID=1081040 RepID=A0ABU0P914_9MICO|nr:HNH endonuclease signature motif containing protein [Microbacterium murale]MDQ0643815.1 murein DD-endopeptidase MepM/ murein hydrolase activator NlpD [Microbacterium murale]
MSKLTGLHEAISRLDVAWADAGDSNDLSRDQLIAVTNAIGLLQRRLDAVHVGVAAGVASESRTELGADSLAKQQGFRTPAKLIAAATGMSTGDAIRLIKVGEATAVRTDLLGARLPAKYPLVSEAMAAGTLSAQAAALIIGVLERCRIAAGPQQTAEGERLLVDAAPGLALDEIRRLVVRVEAWLDPDGVEPREDEQRGKRSLTFFERGGRLHLNGNFDVETGAPIVAALRGYVSAAFAARQDAPDPDAPDADRRTVPMLHVDDLESATGAATIDGIDQPISAAAARRMAADGGVIPCVLGGDSEILDWGRKKRFFTKAQRLALVERDGGCAMCNLPPEMVKAHHMRWWERHHGRTDLSNGILLCESCHHRIHDNGWDIHIDGTGVNARVWFIPPAHVDPARTPRLGGRARFDIAA